MEKFVIEGGERLQGTVRVGGAKNAVLPVLAATLLQEGLYRITNVPRLRDVDSMIKLLSFIGAGISREDDHTVVVDTENAGNYTAPYEIVKEMRASSSCSAPSWGGSNGRSSPIRADAPSGSGR